MKRIKFAFKLVGIIAPLLLSCGSGRSVSKSPNAENPHAIDICESQPLSNHQYEHRGYHAFLAMIESVATHGWSIAAIDVEALSIKAEIKSQKFDYTHTFVAEFADDGKGSVYGKSVLSTVQGDLEESLSTKWVNYILSKFSVVSCYTDAVLEEMVSKRGFTFDRPIVESQPKTIEKETESEIAEPETIQQSDAGVSKSSHYCPKQSGSFLSRPSAIERSIIWS